MDTDKVSRPGTAPVPATVTHAGEPSSRDVSDMKVMDTAPSVDGKAPSSVGQQATLASKHDTAPQPADQHAMETEPAASDSDAPALGTRIEVLWKISHDDDGVEERWWGAVVQDRLHTKVDSISAEHGDRSVHILLYDAYGDFEEDVSRVAFLPGGTLLDLSQIGDENKGILDWREEGEIQEAQMSLEEFVQANQRDLREAGVADDADLTFLSGMPAHVQMHMTSGYRVFADGVREMLSELSQKHPEGYVVTERDVQEWCEKMKRFT